MSDERFGRTNGVANTVLTNPVSSLPVPNGDRHRVTTVALTFGSKSPSWPLSSAAHSER